MVAEQSGRHVLSYDKQTQNLSPGGTGRLVQQEPYACDSSLQGCMQTQLLESLAAASLSNTVCLTHCSPHQVRQYSKQYVTGINWLLPNMPLPLCSWHPSLVELVG